MNEELIIETGSPADRELADRVVTALRGVIDPEIRENLIDLGLVYGLEVREGNVRVVMTLTSPGCPLGRVIVGQVGHAAAQVPGVGRVQVDLTWDPPWSPARISPAARERLDRS